MDGYRDALAETGAILCEQAISGGDLLALHRVLPSIPRNRPGIRLQGNSDLAQCLDAIREIGRIAASVLSGARPVRALLLDKNAETNWSLSWHQDRTIAVRHRVEVEGYGHWTIKSGVLHVEPPFEVISGMVTLRIHLDAVPATNAPLLVAPGSHKLGRIAEAETRSVVERCGTMTCLAKPGDVWVHAAAILHASDAATEPRHRRVLQVDYAVGDLPGGLAWFGI